MYLSGWWLSHACEDGTCSRGAKLQVKKWLQASTDSLSDSDGTLPGDMMLPVVLWHVAPIGVCSTHLVASASQTVFVLHTVHRMCHAWDADRHLALRGEKHGTGCWLALAGMHNSDPTDRHMQLLTTISRAWNVSMSQWAWDRCSLLCLVQSVHPLAGPDSHGCWVTALPVESRQVLFGDVAHKVQRGRFVCSFLLRRHSYKDVVSMGVVCVILVVQACTVAHEASHPRQAIAVTAAAGTESAHSLSTRHQSRKCGISNAPARGTSVV